MNTYHVKSTINIADKKDPSERGRDRAWGSVEKCIHRFAHTAIPQNDHTLTYSLKAHN